MPQLEGIVNLFTKVKDKRRLENLLNELFTPSELKDLSLRWALLEQLHNAVPQREIASRLGISLCKITRGAKILKNKNSEISKWLNENNEINQE